MTIEKCYLLQISLGGTPSKTRITEAARQIKELILQLSPEHQLAYTSGDGGTFGFFLKSRLWANQIAAQINSPGESHSKTPFSPPPPIIPSPLRHEDSMLILEIGDDVFGIGKTKVITWFQHHRPTKQASKSPTVSAARTKQSQLADQLAKVKDKLDK